MDENVINTDETQLDNDVTLTSTLVDNDTSSENIVESVSETNETQNTEIIEYREIDEPCVALTIIGENRLTTSVSVIKHGFKFSIKAFFSSIVLTIMNLFI